MPGASEKSAEFMPTLRSRYDAVWMRANTVRRKVAVTYIYMQMRQTMLSISIAPQRVCLFMAIKEPFVLMNSCSPFPVTKRSSNVCIVVAEPLIKPFALASHVLLQILRGLLKFLLLDRAPCN